MGADRDQRGRRSYREKFDSPDPEERYAMRFALALLMPAEAFRKAVEAGFPPYLVAALFNVPAEAVPLRHQMLTEGVS